ncbi:protein TonB [Mucilaginibacter gossypiicola]|uniref:Protein TonB n=1 Tax=Mucilaginibacter gossypiicola TaxID=551995 RepID=A0A1H8KP11_9SPHI|nr:energy transducer TonB [Mucilaginibacter gossypiicola]SEN94118.1 protein TonB [Mucilaginibacter gossypiicola]
MKKILLTAIFMLGTIAAKAQTTDINTFKKSVLIKTQPEFPGGNKALSQFLTKNLRFPPDDGTDYATTVFVSFVVKKDGRLTNIKALNIKSLKNICPKCKDEALRVIKLSPNWLPEKLDGKAVSSKYVIPIRFDLYDAR